MRLLTRQVLHNLTKQKLQPSTKLLSASGSNIPKRNALFLQNYSSESKKQQLLRFPAFPLEETIAKFLKSTEPFLSAKELKCTTEVTEEFWRNEGAKLQKLLEKCAEKEENWLAHRWLRTAYLQYRDPVTVFSSPGMSFPILPAFKDDEDYLHYAAKIVFGLTSYKQEIDNNKIPVVKMGKFELDNSQFGRVYGTCRIPIPHEDKMEYHPDSQHIVVIYRNNFYKLPVYTENCELVHPEALRGELKKIVKAEKNKDKATEYGILSTAPRDNWAAAYEHLLESDTNKCSVKCIQEALFTLSLDDEVPIPKGSEYSVLSQQLIHGGGSKFNSGNRWMDKTIQVIINRNGFSGFTYEHSPAEGQPIALMVDYVIKNFLSTRGDKLGEGAAKSGYECSEKLKFDPPTSCMELHLEAAKHAVDRLACDLECEVLHYKSYGKEFIKSQKLSPDSFIQMAIQYAFYKLHRVPGAQYESAHLRIYYGGRTETIRSCSNESLAFCKGMFSSATKDTERVQLLRKAVDGHRKYTNMALQGRGVDRHLLGLKLMAIENKMPIPEFYKTPGFEKSSQFRISTSQVASAYEAYMCYGPLTFDGYSCCYNPRECDIFLSTSAWRSCKETNAKFFKTALQESFNELEQLLLRTAPKDAKL